MTERKIIKSVAAIVLVAACNAPESTKTPVPTKVNPTPTTLYIPPTQTSKPLATFAPTSRPADTLTYTPTASRTPVYLPLNTPDFRVPSKCEIKPKLLQENIERLYKTEIYSGNPSRKTMMLTFDDWAEEGQVGYILDVFKRYGAKASFFVNAPIFNTAPNAVKRILSEGHVLGAHSSNHDDFRKFSPDQIDADFCNFYGQSNQIISGYQYRYFRFPYGARNETARWLVASWGLYNVMWSDISGGVDKASSYNQVISRAGNGKIILMHLESRGDVDAIDDIVRKLLELGYSLESIETGLR